MGRDGQLTRSCDVREKKCETMPEEGEEMRGGEENGDGAHHPM